MTDTAGPTLHLLKLCVGAESLDDLVTWRAEYARRARLEGRDETLMHVTRMWPRRSAELLAGGSLYWVVKGVILARQRILALEPVDQGDGAARCGIVLGDPLRRTAAQPRRPFQGWRYLRPEDAPPDLAAGGVGSELPLEMERALAEIGVGWRRK